MSTDIKIKVSTDGGETYMDFAPIQQQEPTPEPEPPKPLRLMFFCPPLNDEYLAVIDPHVKPGDFAFNFRVMNLERYSNLSRVMLDSKMADLDPGIAEVKAHNAAKPDKQIDYMGYDNEEHAGWDTPDIEKQDPGKYTNLAGDKIIGAGFKFVVANSRNQLLKAMPVIDWSKVSAVIVQVQQVMDKPDEDADSFVSVVGKVSAHVRAANPECLIFAQINHDLAPMAVIKEKVDKVRSKVDGISIVATSTTSTAELTELLNGIERL